jgi:hypothetical protein
VGDVRADRSIGFESDAARLLEFAEKREKADPSPAEGFAERLEKQIPHRLKPARDDKNKRAYTRR